MQLTLITILVILFIMCFTQICYRDNFSTLNQEKFRKDHIKYQLIDIYQYQQMEKK